MGGGLTPLFPPEQPEERRESALRGVANHAHCGGVVADLLFGALFHSTRLRPGLDLADPELSLRLTLDLGVAGEVTQRRPSVTQELHAPMIGAQADVAAGLVPPVCRSLIDVRARRVCSDSAIDGVTGADPGVEPPYSVLPQSTQKSVSGLLTMDQNPSYASMRGTPGLT